MLYHFIKTGRDLYASILKPAVFTVGISCICITGVLGEDPHNERSTLVGIKKSNYVNVPPTGLELYQPDTSLAKGIRKMNLKVSGTVRFLTIYRDMSTAYPDMLTSKKNIAFSEYQPIGGGGSANSGGVPNLELLLQSKAPGNINFNVGYSFMSSFTGATNPSPSTAKLTSVNNIWFSGLATSKHVNFSLNAGTILWTSLSRFTMGQPNYRDNYFYRLPWDWYRNDFTRWEEYYGFAANVGTQGGGRSPFSGFVGVADFYRIGVSVTGLYGKTNRTASYTYASKLFPAHVSGVRVEKNIFTRAVDGRVAATFYSKSGYVDPMGDQKDLFQIASVDGKLRWKKILFSSELGMGRINNPGTANSNKFGTGFFVRGDVDKKLSSIPFGVEFYNINYNMVSLDGGIMNSNTTVHDAGSLTTNIYDNMALVNVMQEMGQLANNRRGLALNGEATIKKRLKISLGLSMSQEIDNLHDTITLQHKVNSLARSRFYPWFMAGGPYGNIRSGYMRTYQTITITDANKNYKKGFNTIEMLLKYKATLFGKDLVILNFHNFNSVQDKFSPIPTFTNSNSVFVRQYFTDITLAYRLTKTIALSTYGGVEKVWGSKRIDQVYATGGINPNNGVAYEAGQLIKDDRGKLISDPSGLSLNQLGWGVGVGIDYNFTPTAGLHLRHTRMSQKDKNFTNDVFKGHETNLELKLFF